MSMSVTPGQAIGGHRDWVSAVAFSPRGDQFVAGNRGGGLAVYRRTDSGLFEMGPAIVVPPFSESSRPRIVSVAWTPGGEYIAVSEGGNLRLRRPDDLSEVTSRFGGLRAVGIGGSGAWLAELGQAGVSTANLPDLSPRGWSHSVYRGSFEYFSAKALGVDPTGPLVAVADDGGQDETAMAAITDRGTPQVSLINVDSGERAVIETGEHVHALVFDQWRDRLITGTYTDIGFWTPDGGPLARFTPYPDQYPDAVVVTPNAIVTTPGRSGRSIELWHPETFDLLGRVDGPASVRYGWVAAAPGGQTLLTSEYVQGRSKGKNYGIRVWDVAS
jgi:WD40 repeat protein